VIRKLTIRPKNKKSLQLNFKISICTGNHLLNLANDYLGKFESTTLNLRSKNMDTSKYPTSILWDHDILGYLLCDDQQK